MERLNINDINYPEFKITPDSLIIFSVFSDYDVEFAYINFPLEPDEPSESYLLQRYGSSKLNSN